MHMNRGLSPELSCMVLGSIFRCVLSSPSPFLWLYCIWNLWYIVILKCFYYFLRLGGFSSFLITPMTNGTFPSQTHPGTPLWSLSYSNHGKAEESNATLKTHDVYWRDYRYEVLFQFLFLKVEDACMLGYHSLAAPGLTSPGRFQRNTTVLVSN